MKQSTREWVDKAEADYSAALLLRSSRKKFNRDIVQMISHHHRERSFNRPTAKSAKNGL
jgi:hypothetical protein